MAEAAVNRKRKSTDEMILEHERAIARLKKKKAAENKKEMAKKYTIIGTALARALRNGFIETPLFSQIVSRFSNEKEIASLQEVFDLDEAILLENKPTQRRARRSANTAQASTRPVEMDDTPQETVTDTVADETDEVAEVADVEVDTAVEVDVKPDSEPEAEVTEEKVPEKKPVTSSGKTVISRKRRRRVVSPKTSGKANVVSISKDSDKEKPVTQAKNKASAKKQEQETNGNSVKEKVEAEENFNVAEKSEGNDSESYQDFEDHDDIPGNVVDSTIALDKLESLINRPRLVDRANAAGIFTLGDLLNCSEKQFLKRPGLHMGTLKTFKAILNDMGLSFKAS